MSQAQDTCTTDAAVVNISLLQVLYAQYWVAVALHDLTLCQQKRLHSISETRLRRVCLEGLCLTLVFVWTQTLGVDTDSGLYLFVLICLYQLAVCIRLLTLSLARVCVATWAHSWLCPRPPPLLPLGKAAGHFLSPWILQTAAGSGGLGFGCSTLTYLFWPS